MTKSRTIIFRISDEQPAQIEKAAVATGKNSNDWCRDAALCEAGQNSEFSPNERIIFEELAKARYLIGIGFGLLATEELNSESWNQTEFGILIGVVPHFWCKRKNANVKLGNECFNFAG